MPRRAKRSKEKEGADTAAPLVFRVVDGESAGSIQNFSASEVLIGRVAAEESLVLAMDDEVSSLHAVLEFDGVWKEKTK